MIDEGEDDNENKEVFEIKGPMGIGLRVKPSGLHIAFAAGTGVLPFMDLVAWLAMANLDIDTTICNEEKDLLNLNSFRLILYVSFKRKSDSVALDLLYELSDYCMQHQPAHQDLNFELFVRLSKEGINPDRWNEDFVLQELSKYNPDDVSRIWVCGPPKMA